MEYLYHYTNIESLALILANHTIRFNSLEYMDDLQEKQVGDIYNIGQFCYVSSWTDEEKESIPMWKMYSSLESGVRIRLKKYPFYEFANNPESLKSAGLPLFDEVTDGNYPKSVIPYAEFVRKGFVQIPPLQKNMLFRVEYTDDQEKLFPKIVSQEVDCTSIEIGKLGKYKNTHWAFQNEWRYVFNAYPIDVKKIKPNSDNYIRIIYSKLLSGLLIKPFAHYDLKIADDAYKEMEIVMGPRIGKGNKIIVSSLKEKYNPSATLRESSLVGKI